MTLKSQIAPIVGSMNQDTDPKLVRTVNGEVYSRINLRPNSIGGNKLANEKIKGMLQQKIQLPAGTNKVIGWIENRQDSALIYFVYNSNGDHSILRYFINTKTIQKIFYSESTLNLEDAYVGGFVAEDGLYWVNGKQEPKAFNITMAVNYTNGLIGPAYKAADKPFDYYIFPWYKRPPQFAPTLEYASLDEHNGVSINFNNLRGTLWQFKYNYVYSDFKESPYSSISKVPLPEGEVQVDGDWLSDIRLNNAIYITIKTGGRDVRQIQVAARDCTEYNNGSFYRFIVIDKFSSDGTRLIADNIDYQVVFLNNTPFVSIDTDYGNRYFDNVPLAARDCILLDGKYAALARPLLGYPDLDVDYSLEAVETDVDITEDSFDMNQTEEVVIGGLIHCGNTYTSHLKVITTLPFTFQPNSVYQITVPRDSGNVTATYVTGATAPANYPGDVRDSLFTQLKNLIDECELPPIRIFASGQGSIRMDFLNLVKPDGLTAKVIKGTTWSESIKTLKRGQYHPFGIVYNDGAGRYNVVFGDKEVYSPLVDGSVAANFNKVVQPKITINHVPPVWAKTYRIAYNRFKSYTYFLYVLAVEQIKGEGLATNGVPVGKTFLKINQANERMRLTYAHSQIADYVWQNGDRIRRFGKSESYEITKDYVRSYDDGGDTKTENGFLIDGEFETIQTDVDTGIVDNIEIYRPNTSPTDNAYYEISEEFEILDAGTDKRRHAGNVYNQFQLYPGDPLGVYSVSAVSLLDFGDVYYRYRRSAQTVYPQGLVEDLGYSDYYTSNGINIGRLVAKIKQRQEYYNRVMRSENYLENTETNNLNIFLAGTAYFDVSDIYGDIYAIAEVGDVMKVIQAHKETSVYIGKVNVKEADGVDFVLLSDQVFGAYNRYVEKRGTTYTRSAVANNRYFYYFDDHTGEFIRSAVNGQLAISKKYGMQSWFEAKAKALYAYSGTKDVIVSIDNDYEEVLITFIIGNTAETIVFSENEEEKGWKYFVQYQLSNIVPDNFAFYGDTLISFLQGQLWLHNQSGLNNFYGEQKACSLEFFMNGLPTESKRLSNIDFDSDKNVWDITITTDENINYGSQKTVLKPTIIRKYDTKLTANILRNIIGRNGVEDLNLLYNGNKMAGDVFTFKFANSDGDPVLLHEVEVKFLINK